MLKGWPHSSTEETQEEEDEDEYEDETIRKFKLKFNTVDFLIDGKRIPVTLDGEIELEEFEE